MLYLIGGAARSGKSLVARRLPRGRLVPYSSTDHLISGLAAGAPASAFSMSCQTVCAASWPGLSWRELLGKVSGLQRVMGPPEFERASSATRVVRFRSSALRSAPLRAPSTTGWRA
jgi:hypothetical protein